MTRILRIDASSRPESYSNTIEGSFSRELANRIVDRLKWKAQDAEVVVRDLAQNPVPHISDTTIKGYYTPAEAMTEELRAATALSDELITELRDADAVVISSPIYNFSIPSVLKAWIDQVVRIGHTFSYEDGQFAGMLEDKPVYLALSYGAGGYGAGGPLQAYDQMRPYLTLVLNFIGLTSVTPFAIEATTADADIVAEQRSKSQAAVDEGISA